MGQEFKPGALVLLKRGDNPEVAHLLGTIQELECRSLFHPGAWNLKGVLVKGRGVDWDQPDMIVIGDPDGADETLTWAPVPATREPAAATL